MQTENEENENKNRLTAPNFRTAPSCYTCDKYDHTKNICKEYIFELNNFWGEPWDKICDSHPSIPANEKETK